MIKFFTIPGYARIKPNLTPEKEQVVLQSLNGKAVIGFLLLSELKMDDVVVKDDDGMPSVGQDVYLEMTDDGKVKASGIDSGEIPTESVDYQDLGQEALEAIRRFNLTEGGGVLNIQGDQRAPIETAGGRGFLTDAMIKTVWNATKDMTVADHIIWQFIERDGRIQCKVHVPSSMGRIRFFAENLFNPKYSTSTPNVFFREHVGQDYKSGLRGKRVLVLGESLFCSQDGHGKHKLCPFFQLCTDTARKNSNAFDHKCPFKTNDALSETAKYNVECFLAGNSEGDIVSYQNFTNLMMDAGVAHNADDLFSHVVFYDFMQFFSPERSIQKIYLSERDDMAFEEIVQKHDPHVIIIWGTTVGDWIKAKGRYPARNIRGADDLNYIFNQKIAGRWRTFFCMYHPADSYGYLRDSWDEHVSQAKLLFQ